MLIIVFLDVALDLVKRHPQIALARGKNKETALHLLARMPVLTHTGQEIPDSAFELVERLWKQVMLLDDSKILEIIRKPWSLIFEATKQGNLRFLKIIFCTYPDLMFEVDENHYTI
ncbi:hypothetical protein Pint_12326 [Pistacia integerrima]|uniref:Uncharacterized protein n=1 Tax=Pistacia integerrima TaxID=434235 RepID=A0ACC0XH26_9ROSI|nr:hypothetical protein Pint_12326 [Pistacia integerrima]